jgi:cytochrome c oxidase assembly protein subunit 15
MRERLTISQRAYAPVALATLTILVLIVFSGAAVRTTGSGLGCPDWPDCNGTFVPGLDKHAWIEYSNRLLSSVVGVICIAAGAGALRLRPRRPELRAPAFVLAGGVLFEGALGALVVAFGLFPGILLDLFKAPVASTLAAANAGTAIVIDPLVTVVGVGIVVAIVAARLLALRPGRAGGADTGEAGSALTPVEGAAS